MMGETNPNRRRPVPQRLRVGSRRECVIYGAGDRVREGCAHRDEQEEQTSDRGASSCARWTRGGYKGKRAEGLVRVARIRLPLPYSLVAENWTVIPRRIAGNRAILRLAFGGPPNSGQTVEKDLSRSP